MWPRWSDDHTPYGGAWPPFQISETCLGGGGEGEREGGREIKRGEWTGGERERELFIACDNVQVIIHLHVHVHAEHSHVHACIRSALFRNLRFL